MKHRLFLLALTLFLWAHVARDLGSSASVLCSPQALCRPIRYTGLA